MNVFIDDEPYAGRVETDTTLEQLSETIRGGELPGDRMVIAIQGNGQDLVAKELDEALPRPAIEYERLDFLTESTTTVAIEALETAEQIIEWSVTHQSQPWVENIPTMLQESSIPVSNIVIHFVFLETQSDAAPVMTLTYLLSNNTQIIEKGWKDQSVYTSYTIITLSHLP